MRPLSNYRHLRWYTDWLLEQNEAMNISLSCFSWSVTSLNLYHFPPMFNPQVTRSGLASKAGQIFPFTRRTLPDDVLLAASCFGDDQLLSLYGSLIKHDYSLWSWARLFIRACLRE